MTSPALLLTQLGATLANGGRPSEAEKAYEEALRLRPNYVRALVNRGIAAGNQGNHVDASLHYIQAIKREPCRSFEGRCSSPSGFPPLGAPSFVWPAGHVPKAWIMSGVSCPAPFPRAESTSSPPWLRPMIWRASKKHSSLLKSKQTHPHWISAWHSNTHAKGLAKEFLSGPPTHQLVSARQNRHLDGVGRVTRGAFYCLDLPFFIFFW